VTIIKALVWEPEINVAHIAEKHRISVAEVEAACFGSPVFATGYAGRLRVIGPTDGGRMLAVILAAKGGGVYYPVTARPASRRERELYRQERPGGAA
jgi:uncharacterized DUF497 family protein